MSRVFSPCIQNRNIFFIDISCLQCSFQNGFIICQSHQIYFCFLKCFNSNGESVSKCCNHTYYFTTVTTDSLNSLQAAATGRNKILV